MIDWLLHCSADELRSVLNIERDFEAALENFYYPLTKMDKKGRIALVGIGSVGTSVVDKLYGKLLPIENMVDSFSFLESGGDLSLLLKEGEEIYKNDPLVLVIVITKIDDKNDIKTVLDVSGFAKYFLCDDFYTIPLMSRTACGGSSTLFERINISPVFSEDVCQRSETCTLNREVPPELARIRLYASALDTIAGFLKNEDSNEVKG